MLRALGALALLALLTTCGSGPAASGTSVLLITLDTTRYNALGCCGNPQNPTPNIDRLAAEGVNYLRARTVTPLTLPAHSSMLTGLYPNRHTVFGNGVARLPQSAKTLAEIARYHDVQTAAFVASVVLDRSFGIDQGFETYQGPATDVSGPAREAQLRAPEVVARASEWFERRDRARPFFAWLHFFDPHAPYEPPPELAQAMGDPYLGEVAFVDRSLGPLLERLRADGTLAHTLVIVLGDHGESFNAHGEASHGWYCYDGTLRVPLIVRYPDGYRAGSDSSELVSVVDVFPTALAALGLPLPEGLDGQSLYRAGVAPERGLYFELYNGWASFGWSPQVGWLDARGKYIHSSQPEFYEVERDKQEKRDLASERGPEIARALSSIRAVLARPQLEPDAPGEVGAELRGALRMLGYFGVDSAAAARPDPLAVAALPSPRERRDELVLFHAAQVDNDEGRLDAAVAKLRELLARYPSNALARIYLAGALLTLQRLPEARTVLEELVQQGRARPTDFDRLGLCREAEGDLPGARQAFQRALELDPGLASARASLERLAR